MTALETVQSRKEAVVPATTDEMIEKYLAYQDVGSAAEKTQELTDARNLPELQEYSQALIELGTTEGMPKLVRSADTIRKVLKMSADELGLRVSARAEKSRSWVMREIGKKYYQFQHPDTVPPGERDELENPLAHNEKAKKILNDIVNTRLGHEANQAYRVNKDGWAVKILTDHMFVPAKDVMIDETDPANPQIKTFRFEELGETLRRIVPLARAEREMNSPPTVPDHEPRLIDTGDMPGAIPSREDTHAETATDDEEDEDIEAELESEEEHTTTAVAHEENIGTTTEKSVTPAKLAKATAMGAALLPLVVGGVAAWEFTKTAWQSVKGMFNVAKGLFKKRASFKAINESPDAAGTAKAAEAKHDAGHGKGHGADHGGHGGDHGGGHGGDHGSADHGKAGAKGHDAHGKSGGHGKPHGGDHGKKKSKGKGKGKGGGGHH